MIRHDGTDAGYFWCVSAALYEAVRVENAEEIKDCLADLGGMIRHAENPAVRCAASLLANAYRPTMAA